MAPPIGAVGQAVFERTLRRRERSAVLSQFRATSI